MEKKNYVQSSPWQAEAFIPLALVVHGAAMLLFQGAEASQIYFIGALAALSLFGFSSLSNSRRTDLAHSTFLVLANWILMIATGEVWSFFLIWYFLLVSTYSLLRGYHWGFRVLVVLGIAYPALMLVTPTDVSPMIVGIRSLLLIFIGLVSQSVSVITTDYTNKLGNRQKELNTLISVSNVLRSTGSRSDVMPVILNELVIKLDVEGAAIALVNHKLSLAIFLDSVGKWNDWVGSAIPLDKCEVGKAISNGKSFLTDNALEDPYFVEHEILNGQTALACFPVKIGDKITAAIFVGKSTPIAPEMLPVFRAVGNMTASILRQATLSEELESSFVGTILSLAKTIDARDSYTGIHSQDMVTWALAIADALDLPKDTRNNLAWSALLHDIGKIGIPDKILLKPKALTPDEWDVIKRHPEIGAEIIAPISKLEGIAPIIRAHQEWYDGSGYPYGLAGEDIPLEARILAVVDAYSAITDNRVYRKARSHSEAVTELIDATGTRFDPDLVGVFIGVMEEEMSVQH